DSSLVKAPVKNVIENTLRPKMADKKLETLSYPWVGYISDVEGKVLVTRSNTEGTVVVATFEAKEGDLVHSKDSFEVRPKSSINILLKNETEISLGPKTAFKIYQHYVDDKEQNSLFNLLYGNARVEIKNEKKTSSVKLYAPNVVVTAKKADFAVSYSNSKKMAIIADLSGDTSVVGTTDSKERKSYAQPLAEDEYLEITTSYDGEKEIYLNSDPAKMTRNYKKQVLESLNASYREIDPWEFTRIETSFFRIAPGFEYATIRELSTSYYNFSIGYIPLIHTFSVFYLEPYFFVSMGSSSKPLMRAGANIEVYAYRGFYLGTGLGAFWLADANGSKMDFNLNLGYTFSDKQLGVFDGFRFGYFISKTPIYHDYSLVFSIVLNFSSGRNEDY
ncbi:MAG: FecR domain-containing protein, partial [bacterium]